MTKTYKKIKKDIGNGEGEEDVIEITGTSIRYKSVADLTKRIDEIQEMLNAS